MLAHLRVASHVAIATCIISLWAGETCVFVACDISGRARCTVRRGRIYTRRTAASSAPLCQSSSISATTKSDFPLFSPPYLLPPPSPPSFQRFRTFRVRDRAGFAYRSAALVGTTEFAVERVLHVGREDGGEALGAVRRSGLRVLKRMQLRQ